MSQDILDQIYFCLQELVGPFKLGPYPEIKYTLHRAKQTLAEADAEIRGLRELNASLQLQVNLLRKEDA
jgi:hypothetical protein